MRTLFLFSLTVILLQGIQAFGTTPMEYFNSLVAGGHDPSYRDGSFVQARFNLPEGLALDNTGTRLFVADTANNRVRIIYLDQNNRVETLAGSGAAGKEDGQLLKASFNQPIAIASLPGGNIAVFDYQGSQLRLVDPKAQTVATIGLSADGKTPAHPAGTVWSMVYFEPSNSLYLAEPFIGRLEKINMKTQIISLVLSQNPQVPAPKALCSIADKIYIADQSLPTLYQMVESQPSNATGQSTVSLIEAGKGDHMRELAASDGKIYALQDGKEAFALVSPNYKEIKLPSAWGFFMDNRNKSADPFLKFDPTLPVGFVPSTEPREFFVSFPNAFDNTVVSVKDYDFEETWNARTPSVSEKYFTDFSYPVAKPKNTFRILVAGDSRVVTGPVYFPNAGIPGHEVNLTIESDNSLRVNTFPKQLEFLLNADAALRNLKTRFEVLTVGRPATNLQFFINDQVLPVIKKYDVDLVVAYVGRFGVAGILDYFLNPTTPEGIPKPDLDPEYLLKPLQERITPGVPRQFYDRCKKLGFLNEKSADQPDFGNFSALFNSGDKEIRDDMIDMVGLPLRIFSKKFKTIKLEGGAAPKLLMCYVPNPDPGRPIDGFESFWRDLLAKNQISLLDLTEPYTTLETSFYPANEYCCNKHFTVYGNYLIAYLLKFYLIDQKWIPFDTASNDNFFSK